MQRRLRDRLILVVLLLLASAIFYEVGIEFSFAGQGKGPPNCNNCPCKNVTAWQVATDGQNQAHGYQQQTQANPPAYMSILTAQVNIATVPNSCSNQTGNTNQVNGTYANWNYFNAAPVCQNGVAPQEMSPSDKGALQVAVGVVNVCQ